jgi:hypothetical protein
MTMRVDLLNKALELSLEPSGPCPGGEALYRFTASTCSAQERQAIEGHILSCASCMEIWRETHSLLHGSIGEGRRAETPVPITLLPTPLLHRRRWIAAALAAGFAGILLTGGWAAMTLSSLRKEVSTLKSATAKTAEPALAAILDLSPESLTVRGPGEQAAVLRPGPLSSVLVLNSLEPYRVPVTVALLGGDGQPRWSKVLSEPPPGPVTLFVPPGLLPAGAYTAEVSDSATGALRDRYPFELK